ncbi:MAG: response regulator transcription factor [Myxococcales bacterium]|nr:response regulator transcription factor [Myxococcales bacterium]
MSASILIVEDEREIADALAYNLENAGYRTTVAETGETALEQLRQQTLPDLILLDLMLPDVQGTEICRQVRSTPRTRGIPVVMLTAKGEEIDRVVGFEVGADDYVTKPFSVREVVLRVGAILRRSHTEEPAKSDTEFGALRMDHDGHRAWVEGRELSLTALEFRLLDTLLSRRGRVQTREVLLEDVWNMSSELTTRTVDTHVKRLRQKLGSAGAYIETLRGVGYRFRDRPESTDA